MSRACFEKSALVKVKSALQEDCATLSQSQPKAAIWDENRCFHPRIQRKPN